MKTKFEIGDDGTIFSICEDGTILRFGKIDDQGRIKRYNGILWLFLIAAIITAIVLWINFSSAKSSLSAHTHNENNLKSQIAELKQKNEDYATQINVLQADKIQLASKINLAGSYLPIIIKSLKIGNVYKDGSIETDYGNTLYNSNTMFIQPQIEYIGLKTYQTVVLYQKLYKNGILQTGTSSPYGYSTKCDVYIYEDGTTELMGWGYEMKGCWSAGSYRYEIWYNNICLKALDFTIY
jgi:hypothetical protein